MNREDVAIDVTIQDVEILRNRVAELETVAQQVGDLLAVIHRDGGHYQDEHGIAKAIIDAKEVVNQDRIDLNEWQHAAETADSGAKKLADYAVQLEGKIASKHPEQAGGDERAAFNRWIAEQQPCQGSDISLFKLERNGALVSLHELLRDAYQAGQDRAALAQPSPAQAEAERPEVVARVVHSNPVVLGQCGPLNANDELMTVAQHAASVARWAEMFNRVEQQRDAALARVAELEMLLRKLSTNGLMQFSTVDEEMAVQAALGGAPVSQAQQLHDLDKQCRDDVARALGLRPSQERGFAWSYLLTSIKSCVKASEDSAQAQHSVPDGAADLCRFLAKLYCELDGLRYSTAKLPAEQIADALIFKWPVLQGARNQLNIKRISEQPYDESKLHSAIAAMLAAAPAQGGE
ncbi:TPA: hypothetical protein NID48_005192 [Pseudomonas aeruginosa]|nr:hypothetical protein [Pseudomonas aeruginosa]